MWLNDIHVGQLLGKAQVKAQTLPKLEIKFSKVRSIEMIDQIRILKFLGVPNIIVSLDIIIVETLLKILWFRGNKETLRVIRDSSSILK